MSTEGKLDSVLARANVRIQGELASSTWSGEHAVSYVDSYCKGVRSGVNVALEEMQRVGQETRALDAATMQLYADREKEMRLAVEEVLDCDWTDLANPSNRESLRRLRVVFEGQGVE